jgi:acetolactate synthase-1/2/3 large subunit
MVEMAGAKGLICALEKENVDIVFGLPGGANLPIYDALVDAGHLRHILVRHEQSAAHMADGYARIKRRAGVCFATSGPGATNLITGIATAYADSSPLIAVTGQVPLAMIGKDAFQETDIIGVVGV